MDITPTTTPHTPEYPHTPHRTKEKPITKLSGVPPERSVGILPLILTRIPEVKSVFRHRLSREEKELLEKLNREHIRLGGDITYPDYEQYWPEEVFSPRDCMIAEYIKDCDWDELCRYLAPVTPTDKQKRRNFLQDYRRLYNKIQKFNPDFDGYNPLSDIVSRLTKTELQIMHDILKNGMQKTVRRLLGTTPPPPDSPEAETYERTLRRLFKVEEEMRRSGIDIPH
jgi:hypothetical protein